MCRILAMYEGICDVYDPVLVACVFAPVPVRAGSDDCSDTVVLGVSEPSVHGHALRSGELPSSRR